MAESPRSMVEERVKLVYTITYPNGKIYVGSDRTDDITYFGSPDPTLIAADFSREERRRFTVTREVSWEAEDARDAEMRRREIEAIRALGANNPAVGYNRHPRFRGWHDRPRFEHSPPRRRAAPPPPPGYVETMVTLALFGLAACGPVGDEHSADPGSDFAGDSGDSAPDSGDTAPDSGDTAPDSGDTAPPGEVHPNWTDDVAPLLYAQCVECHREGGIGPFRLDRYADAAAMADLSLVAMRDRTMPPYLVDNSGECRTYADARWLTDADIDQLEAWIELGMPEGEGETPTLAPADTLDEVTATLDIGGDYTPILSAGDQYRCFPVEWGFSGNTFLTAYTTTPGDASIVHHTTLYTLYDADQARYMEALDAEDAETGFDCTEGPLVEEIDLVAVWNPGTGVTRLPGGSGILVNGDLPGLLRIHYAGTTDDHVDHTTMELTTADEVETGGFLVGFDDRHIHLEPGLDAAVETADYRLSDFGVTRSMNVWGVNPHMHARGYAMELWRSPDTDPECVERLRYWDYGWQQMFWYEEPFLAAPDDLFRLSCTYDTRGDDAVVEYGQTSTSEMCLTILYLTMAG